MVFGNPLQKITSFLGRKKRCQKKTIPLKDISLKTNCLHADLSDSKQPFFLVVRDSQRNFVSNLITNTNEKYW